MRNDSRTTGANDDGFRRIEVITGVARRRRWTDEEKAWIVAESLEPTTTVSAVARRYGLRASQLFVWRQRLVEHDLLRRVLEAQPGQPAPVRAGDHALRPVN